MERWVDISFDCLPLRSITRLDIPLDASPTFRAWCERVKAAIDRHGSHNTYYLHNARCVYRLTNSDECGMIEFGFEGVVLTDETDMRVDRCDLTVELVRETCDWLTEPVVRWLADTVPRSVAVEFDRYIEAGDREKTIERIQKLQDQADAAGGFVGMYL
jgi:hypothetical protein